MKLTGFTALLAGFLLFTTLSSCNQTGQEILVPQQLQVFQRYNATTGKMLLKLTALDSIGRIVVAVTQNGQAIKTETYEVNLSPGAVYVRSMILPAGGWYQVSVQELNLSNGKSYSAQVNQVGIGDVYVTAGQSNSVNYGQTRNSTNSGKYVALNPNNISWQIGYDPQPGLQPAPQAGHTASDLYSTYVNTQGSTWPSMGDALVNATHIPTATIMAGYGGSQVKSWQKGDAGGLYARLKTAVQLAVSESGGLRMILWHQGEADSLMGTPEQDYESRLHQVQLSLNADFGGGDIPWMVARAAFVPENNGTSGSCDTRPLNAGNDQQITSAQTALAQSGACYAGPSTDDLVGPTYRYPGAGCIHLSTTGAITTGQRWAAQILAVPNFRAFTPAIRH